jgi:hypothetical protein
LSRSWKVVNFIAQELRMGFYSEVEHQRDELCVRDFVAHDVRLPEYFVDLVLRERLFKVLQDLPDYCDGQFPTSVLVEHAEGLDQLSFRICLTRVPANDVQECVEIERRSIDVLLHVLASSGKGLNPIARMSFPMISVAQRSSRSSSKASKEANVDSPSEAASNLSDADTLHRIANSTLSLRSRPALRATRDSRDFP